MIFKISGKVGTILDDFGDPEISTRISQYEMAYRMQTSVACRN
jgi:hypothetical protein